MNNLKEVFEILNEMKAQGVLLDYAVGGAVASLFYVEATRTYDLDIFAILPNQSGLLIDLGEVYDWAKNKGFGFVHEHIMICGIPVQILSGNEGLERESVEKARLCDYDGIVVRVVAPEHLVALYRKAGGAKRKERELMLCDISDFKLEVFDDIMLRYKI
jgi:Nucleotidyl transferase of unknown function (DUF2204)